MYIGFRRQPSGMISGVDSSMMSGIDATEDTMGNSSELLDYR